MTDTHPARCLYECPDHHGAGPKAHTIDCVLPSPMAAGTYVCDNCRADIARQEIAADPYYSGDNYALFGDDE
ncbi:hypothetical protein ABIA35_005996 [Catenulispora sp. MAP12-49]|uniref:hypothetical protein n=1 Tax=Catenulispora sp. MAP12-49 TaxID=3156302 RepID=UPI0035127B84